MIKNTFILLAVCTVVVTSAYYSQNIQEREKPRVEKELCENKVLLHVDNECDSTVTEELLASKQTFSEPTKKQASSELNTFTTKKVVKKKPTERIYGQTRVPKQSFTIDSDREAVISTEKGTMAVIPRNAFVDANGKAVTGDVEITLREVLSKSDLILSNVPTISDGKLLETNGSMEIRAFVGQEELALAEGKSIYVELPTENPLGGMSVFEGTFSDEGNINWTETGELSDDLFTMPFSSLDLKVASLSVKFYNEIIQEKNDDTYLATREFEQRLHSIDAEFDVHGRTNEIVEFYIKNVGDDLAVVDQKVLNYMKGLSHCTPFVEQFDALSAELERYRSQFINFRQENLRHENLVHTYGIDEINEEAKSKLLNAGLSVSQTEEILSKLATRNAIIAQRAKIRAEKDSLAMQRALMTGEMRSLAMTVATNNFEIENLGWINCDRFRKIRRPCQFAVKATGEEGLWAESFIVFKNSQSMLSGTRDESGKYTYFKRVPKNEPVMIVSIGVNKRGAHVGIQEAITGQDEVVNVFLQQTTLEGMKDQMLALN